MSNFVNYINRLQKKNRFISFVVAVVHKYSKDEAGRHVVILTYYMFTSLFPLLLVVTTVIDRVATNNAQFRDRVINAITSYFPVLGDQLSNEVHGLHSSGAPLLFGLLFILYGARGVADSFGRAVRQVWGVKESEVSGFPKSIFRNLYLVVVGGIGFILASSLATLAASAGHGLGFRILSIALNALILFCLFMFLINVCLPKHISLKEIGFGAACATIGLVILQLVGGFIVGHELRHLNALYSYFALALGLLFWLYLQAQVVLYAIEISVVRSKKLWPINLT